ncbi:unnamed protein product [Closterium sp. NIES-64]|nr:unnamed protein product [Closterium sp. NIES-64]
MATLRSVFVLALILVSLPALYAASAPKPRGDDAAAAGDAAARWGRELLEASRGSSAASGASAGANADQLGGEEDEVTGGLDEAVRVLIGSGAWESVRNNLRRAAERRAAGQAGGLAEKQVRKGGVAAGGSAGVGVASWGRKLLEASSGAAASGADVDVNQLDVHVGGEEEEGEVGEATDGVEEAVRVLLNLKKIWKKMKNTASNAAGKAGSLVKNAVEKGGVSAIKAGVNAYVSGQGVKGAVSAAGGSLAHTAKTKVVTLSHLTRPYKAHVLTSRPNHTPPSPLPRSAAASPAPITPSPAAPTPLCPHTSLPPPSTPLLTLAVAEARPEPRAVRGGAAAEAEVAGGFRKGGAEEGRALANGGACDVVGGGGRGCVATEGRDEPQASRRSLKSWLQMMHTVEGMRDGVTQ